MQSERLCQPDWVSLEAPASKSLSHRAVIAAGLAHGQSFLFNVLDSDDLTRTMDCLARCGAHFSTENQDGKKVLVVHGTEGRPRGGAEKPVSLAVHESGTTCRLITAVAAAGSGRFRIHGAARIHERPVLPLTRALGRLGSSFVWENREGYPPFVLRAQQLAGGKITVDISQSSQYLSALLLACACAHSKTIIELTGTGIVSWPYVALTLETMERFGVPVQMDSRVREDWQPTDWRTFTGMHDIQPGSIRFCVSPGQYQAGTFHVEGDWSNASYFLAAGALGQRPVQVTGLRRNSLQADRALVDILAQMGARISQEEDSLVVRPPATGRLQGLDIINMGNCPDIVPTVAILAATAKTPTYISNVDHLRIKECDRLDALQTAIYRAGGQAAMQNNMLCIRPSATLYPEPCKRRKKVSFCTYGDHRIAMATALLEFAGIVPEYDDPDCVKKSFPAFWQQWQALFSKLHSPI